MYYDTCESGKRIQELRKSHGLTQERFAEDLNISYDHLRKIESGQRGCSVDLLIAISTAFDVSLDYLVLGREHINAAASQAIQSAIESLMAVQKSL